LFEIAIMNPRSKTRRKAKRRSKHTVKMKRNAKGRFVKRASNPRKRRVKHRRSNPKQRHSRRRRSVARASNPRRRKYRRSNPHRRHYRVRRRSNPVSIRGLTAGIVPMLTDGAIGGAGALLNSVALGYLSPMLPATFTTGYAYDAVRIASAALIGVVGKKFGGRKGEIAGQGAMAVAMYFLLRDVMTAMVPTLPLGDYEEVAIDNTADQIGAYMDPAATLGAYMPKTGPMGAYMRGMPADYGEAYDGESDGFLLAGTGGTDW